MSLKCSRVSSLWLFIYSIATRTGRSTHAPNIIVVAQKVQTFACSQGYGSLSGCPLQEKSLETLVTLAKPYESARGCDKVRQSTRAVIGCGLFAHTRQNHMHQTEIHFGYTALNQLQILKSKVKRWPLTDTGGGSLPSNSCSLGMVQILET